MAGAGGGVCGWWLGRRGVAVRRAQGGGSGNGTDGGGGGGWGGGIVETGTGGRDGQRQCPFCSIERPPAAI